MAEDDLFASGAALLASGDQDDREIGLVLAAFSMALAPPPLHSMILDDSDDEEPVLALIQSKVLLRTRARTAAGGRVR